MSTTDNPVIRACYDAITVPNKQLGGIVGNAAHAARGGYHIGRAFQPTSNYSVQGPRDNRGEANQACALDITLDAAGMRLVTSRLALAAKAHDPRLSGVKEFAGTLDNRAVYGLDIATLRQIGPEFDTSHLYHVHISFHRDTASDPNVVGPVADIINGTTTEDDDMDAATKAQIAYIYTQIRGAVGKGQSSFASTVKATLAQSQYNANVDARVRDELAAIAAELKDAA